MRTNNPSVPLTKRTIVPSALFINEHFITFSLIPKHFKLKSDIFLLVFKEGNLKVSLILKSLICWGFAYLINIVAN